MEATTSYRDLLWDFTQEASGRQGEVVLRVYATEQELFETRGRGGQAFPVYLPIDRAARMQMTKGDFPRGAPPDPAMLADMGRRLWEALPPDARGPLVQASRGEPVRLKISSNSPGIDDLPWEWLNDGSGPPLALRPEIRLARTVPVMLPLPPLSLRPPFRVLLVVSNPQDEVGIQAAAEVDAIAPALGRDPYKLEILWEPTMESLTGALRADPQPAIVHYVGHAGIHLGEGSLVLQDPGGRSDWLTAADLSGALPVTVGLLCLSTPFTAPNYRIEGFARLAHVPASRRLPTCVITRYPVGAPGVRRFWEVFYAALAVHGNAVEAHASAQRAAAGDPSRADWGSFSLVIRDQSGQVMRITTRGPLPMKRNEQEIVARVTAQMANDAAARSLAVGDLASELTWEQLDRESKAAQRYSKGL